MRLESEDKGTPWYLNSWPWFIVILLSISVVGSLATVVIAYRHRDVDVRGLVEPRALKEELGRVPIAPDSTAIQQESEG
jgi:hypothetical protein